MDPSEGCAAPGQLALLVIGLGPIGVEAALALAESARCCVSLVDDAVADSQWRKSASCLIHQRWNGSPVASGDATAPAGAGKATTRSQYLASVLTTLSKRNVRATSPGGDASIVEDFKAVILTDPTLPHAIAFNEHARAVRCGFFLVEGRGAVGRIFRDLSVDSVDGSSSDSLRRALLEPLFSTEEHHDNFDVGDGVQLMVPTPPTMITEVDARRGIDVGSPLRSRYRGVNRRASSSLVCVREQTEGASGVAAAEPSPHRQAQFHVFYQALHIFWQEHGHLPIVFDRDQAHEVVRIAEEVVETTQKVPGGRSWQPESIDADLCCRMATISRVAVPAVSFQLGGLVAAAALDLAERYHDHQKRRGVRGERMPLPEARGTPVHKGEPLASQWGAGDQWTFIDTLDTGLSENCPGGRGLSTGGSCNGRIQAVEPLLLESWLGSDLGNIVSGARVAVIGCGRLGRDVARCLLLSGACAGPRGRMVFIDQGGVASSADTSSDNSISPSRAAVIRDLALGYTGSGRLQISAFDGAAHDMDLEMDLWEGVDAVVVCAGRKGGKKGGGGAEAGDSWREAGRLGCEALLRFVSHKCVLHAKPLVWGWAGGRGEGGAGVEAPRAEGQAFNTSSASLFCDGQVMAPGRTSCLVCSSHGGVQQLIKRRKTTRTEATLPPDDRVAQPPHICLPVRKKRQEDDDGDKTWDPRGHSFSVARSAVAGAAVAELVKVLKPRCRREELQNWRFEVGGGSSSSHSTRSGSSKYDEGKGGHEIARKGNETRRKSRGPCHRRSLLVDQSLCRGNMTTIRPIATTPDPPRTVLSTPFDSFTGDSLRAIPEGFTEWGVENIRPSSMDQPETWRSGNGSIDSPFSLRALAKMIFARFGVDVKSVAIAASGSECRIGAGRCFERGDARNEQVLWAEWEKAEGDGAHQDSGRRRNVVSKMDLSVLSLWQQVSPRTPRGEKRRRALPGGKEPRFLFLDIGGVMGEENVVLPVLKYWVR